MTEGLAAPLLLLSAPAVVYFAWRLGLMRRRWARALVLAVAGIAVLAALPWHGLDFAVIKRINLFLAGGALLFVLLRGVGVPWASERRTSLPVLAALAVLSLLTYLDFLTFHGARTFVHYHDVAHYYLGSKYFAELGYSRLYTAMLRAEAEVYDNHFKSLEARDLETDDVVHIVTLLRRSDEAKAAFSPERWAAFKQDVAYFRDVLGPAYPTVLNDHGFNATPVWAAMGGVLANRVRPGDHTAIVLLALLDPLLLAGAFAAVVWAFGWEAALFALIQFCLVFGATFGWTGGAFLRYVWFFGAVVALCCLHRGRYAVAGGLLALATGLRVFPILFVFGIAAKMALDLLGGRRALKPHVRMLAAFAATGLALFLLTGLSARGFGAWEDFRRNTGKHMETVSPNIVGLTGLLAYEESASTVDADQIRAIRERRTSIYHVQLLTALPLVVIVALLLAPERGDLEATLLGIPLIFVGLNLAAYYYVFLVLVTLVFRERPRVLLALFGLELASYSLLLFEEREARLFVYRDLLILFLLAALYREPLASRLRGLRARS